MSEQQMKIWDRVSKTDTTATKSAKVNGQQISSIDGYWVIRLATNIFGPIGIGWGYDIIEERLDDGKPFGVKQEDGSVMTIIAKTHTIKLLLWYKIGGERGEITQYGHTPAIYKSSYGVSDDSEAPKKSLMDAIKKSLSMLGFCADVFMGQFDNPEYRQQLETEQAIEKAENREAAIESKRAETVEYVQSSRKTMSESKTVSEVRGVAKVALRHLEHQKKIHSISDICEKGIKAIALESEEKIRELSK